MDSFLQDLKYGFRQLRKSPAFTLAAGITLALGIGANATIFTWLSAVVLNPVPGVDSSNLIFIRWHTPQGGRRSLSWLDFLDLQKRNHTLKNLAVGAINPLSLGEGSQPERVWSMLVSANYFDTLGVKPALGRTFSPEEDRDPGGHPVVVLSHHIWQTKFGGDPHILGRQILLNKRSFTVIGVTPEPFIGSTLGLRFDLWLPVSMVGAISGDQSILDKRGVSWLDSQARANPGVDKRAIEADLTAISSQMAREFSQSDRYNRAEVVPIWREGGGSVLAPVMMLLMGVVSVVLLIACANVANLLLARAAGRQREIAIRLALGVRRVRLMRQLLLENSLLALGGLAAALVALPSTMGAIMGFAPPSDLPVTLTIRADARVYLFTIGITAAATLLFGLLPALRASRTDVVSVLKEESGASASRGKAWLRNSLVIAQVALSLVLLVSAGLFLKALSHATSANPGFEPRNVLVAGIDLQPNGYDEARGSIAVRQITDKLSALPGVTSVSTIRVVPLGLGGSSSSRFAVDGYVPAKDEELIAYVNFIGPDYFRTMKTPLVAGREFTSFDAPATPHVVVVNETFARRYFAHGDPVGRRVRIYGEERVVAGVARDSKAFQLDEKPQPFVYLPASQVFASETNFLVRTSSDPLAYARPVEDAVHSVDPAMPVYGVRPLEAAISASYFGQRMGGSFLGLFGAIALALAAIGLYGVLAYTVTQRSREVGIRIALGASRADILRLVLGQGLRLLGFGLAIGLALAFAVTRLMRSMLLDVSATDLPTILAVSALLTAVALLASFIPAQRATTIDPILAIRHE
ncbi:MAG: ABC transporter permease [Acidobacteriia bacterium]|nr:ABC transporter permease [Terriglobia bacterium]